MFIIVFFALKTVPLLIISTNAMTSELASFITSVFTMDLLDIDSMLRKDSNLTESEQKVIYRQAKDIQEVLSWFNVKPTGVNQTLEVSSLKYQHFVGSFHNKLVYSACCRNRNVTCSETDHVWQLPKLRNN